MRLNLSDQSRGRAMKRLNVLAIVCVALLGYAYAQALTSHPGVPPCVPKPYPVTIDLSKFPPEMHEGLIKFVDDMNYRIIDEIYLRFCNYIADSIYPGCDSICIHIDSLLDLTDTLVIVDSLIWDSLGNIVGVTCLVEADTIQPCTFDTLTLLFKTTDIKHFGTDGVGATLRLFEDTSRGGQYAGFMVQRDDGSLFDTNDVTTSYVLVMPENDGDAEDRAGPAGDGYTLGLIKGNSELLTDATGNLYWIDRDWFPRLMVDTITADTSLSGQIYIEAEFVHFRADTQRSIIGQWGGGGAPEIRMYEDIANGGSFNSFRTASQQKASNQWVWPDTAVSYEAAFLRFEDGGFVAPTWAPYDDEFILRGTDSVPAGTTEWVVQWRTDALRDPGRSASLRNMKMTGRAYYQVYVSWVRGNSTRNIDSFGTGPVGGAPYKYFGCPDPSDTRWDELRVNQWVIGSALTYIDVQSGGNEGGVGQTSDSSFTVLLPAFGDDTVKVFTWTIFGRLVGSDGEG